MAEANTDSETAEYIAFEEFRDGLPHGRFRVIVNPELARQFVAHRFNAIPVVIAVVGCGVAGALAGYPIAGAIAVAAGLLIRRTLRWQAPKILLQLASRQAAAYHDATAGGVMEVRRV
jgi:hypothetical protein